MDKQIFVEEQHLSEINGFDDHNDIFGYEEFADRLSILIGSISGKTTVFVLDGAWGSGKSYFVRQFAGLMRQKGAPVILFDSFASDYVEDGFIALAAAIHHESKEILKSKPRTLRNYLTSAKSTASFLLPAGVKIALRATGNTVIDLDAIKRSGIEVSDAIKSIIDEGEKAIDAIVTQKINQVSKEKAIIQRFQYTLTELSKELSNASSRGNSQYPLVFIVDELDRCRPEFSLSILEKIKHIFNVHNVCFILVANLSQLEASVRGIYGQDFDGKLYLEKFYQYKILLPADHGVSEIRAEKYLKHLFLKQQLNFGSPDVSLGIIEFIVNLAQKYNLQLRQIERIVTNLSLVHRATNERYLVVSPLIAGLCVMRIVKPLVYEQVRRGQIDQAAVQEFLLGEESNMIPQELEKSIGEWEAGWWKFAAGGTTTQDVIERFRAEAARYRILEGKDLLITMCSYIDEFAQN